MSIVLFRVDERLIHGQVVVGWGSSLRPQHIIVVDDALAQSKWEQELYTFGLPDDLKATFADVQTARAQLPSWRSGAERVMVLTRDIASMRDLGADGLLRGEEINLGGIHHSSGRRQVLPYLFLSADEARAMMTLSAAGAKVSARDLPSARRIEFADLVRNAGVQ